MSGPSLHRSVRIAVALVLSVAYRSPAQSQSPPGLARCESLVVSQQAARQNRKRPYELHLRASNGAELTYFGVRHTNDPADTQFVSLEREFKALAPTVVFYEGAAGRTAATAEESVRAEGEPGLARFLARSANVPAKSLEPARADETAALLRHFPAEQLVMFYTLRPIMELRTREGVAGPPLDTALARQLAFIHRLPGLENALPDTAALRSAFAARFRGIDMLALPPDWFDPALLSDDVPKRLFNAINYESSMYRDIHMYRLLATAALDSTAKIFAEVGRDHIPAQAAALRCALGAP